jgi:hypothetical protein
MILPTGNGEEGEGQTERTRGKLNEAAKGQGGNVDPAAAEPKGLVAVGERKPVSRRQLLPDKLQATAGALRVDCQK